MILAMRSGYGRPAPQENSELTHVGPGTPVGELFRRYWQPVGLSPAARARHPPGPGRGGGARGVAGRRPVRVRGEDLVLFRDGHGRPGLLDAHCCYRGTSLEYGRVEVDGIRCCY